MATVVVERTWEQPVTPELLAQAGAHMVECLSVRNGRWIRSMITPDGRRTICTFEAPDAEAVRQTYREQGVSFDAIWAAHTLESPDER